MNRFVTEVIRITFVIRITSVTSSRIVMPHRLLAVDAACCYRCRT